MLKKLFVSCLMTGMILVGASQLFAEGHGDYDWTCYDGEEVCCPDIGLLVNCGLHYGKVYCTYLRGIPVSVPDCVNGGG